VDSIDFEELVGQEFDFYGVDGNCFKLDDVAYETIDGDGLDEVRICHDQHRFHELPIARVVVEGAAFSDEVYELIDLHDGHRWLAFGTEICFTSERSYDVPFLFEYTPKETPLD
jgi:hypothetical protein